MKRMLVSLLAAVGMIAAAPAVAKSDGSGKSPNFLIIVADDLGFSDIGAFGGEIATPNLDALAQRGVRLTGFHTAPTCSPTRAMLLTGLDHHEAGVGNMAEMLTSNQKGRPNHEGYLRADTATLAELLAAGGYRTHYSGKWHLGTTPGQDPHARGFQTTFAMLNGGHNHFGVGVSKDRNPYGAAYTENGRQIFTLPADFYSSDYFSDKLVAQLKAGKAGGDGGKPFFAYLAYTAPHFPLHAPPETIAKYKGRYDGGYEALREQRLKRQVELGLLDAKVPAHDFDLARRWDALSPQEKALDARRMEVFAAMVDRMDQGIGRVIQTLKDTGEYDNTVILFLSDNGAEGSILGSRSMGMLKQVVDRADNSLENIGKATSYDGIGPGWAEAATAPSWRVKGYQTEGGTRVISILSGPGIKPDVGRDYTNVADVTPTFLDLAGLAAPRDGRFAGRRVLPVRGRSWRGWLNGKETRVYPANQPVGGELFGGRGLRQGDWKLVDNGDGQWRLFDLASDPGETKDIAAAQPKRVAELTKAWDDYAKQVGVIMPDHRMPILDRPAGR